METDTKEYRSKKVAFLKYWKDEGNDPREVVTDFETLKDDYLILTDEEADEQAKEYIKDSLWAFNADFIIGECGLDFSGVESLKKMQEKSCEGANDFILSLVEKTCGLASFVEAAISADGRGHFLSSYDGEENEVTVNGKAYYIYRVN